MEAVIEDGTMRQFSPEDDILFEDRTGQGHTSRGVGGDLCVPNTHNGCNHELSGPLTHAAMRS